jgi:hypothetical protein
MRKYISIIVLFLFFIFYLYASFVLRQALKHSYDETSNVLERYPQWGLDTKAFVILQQQVLPHLSTCYIPKLPFTYTGDSQKLKQIVHLAEEEYATTLIRKKTELDNRISYVRDRIMTTSGLGQPYRIAKLKELQDVSGTVFEQNPTLYTIASASAATKHIDESVNNELERIRKDALFSQLTAYQETCNKNKNFFREKNSEEGIQLADACLLQITKLSEPTYKENGSDFLETLIGERIYSLVTKTDAKRNQITQEEIFAELEKRKQQERLTLVPPAAVTAGKVIVVNLDLQRLYAYENGTSLFPYAVPITSGKQGFETVKGEYSIYYKQMYFKMTSPFPGIYYDNVVTYWMPFYLGYGLHDASWRFVYGTQDYPSVGSHGCVNVPLKEVAMLYNWAEVGTKVYVY